MTKSTICILFPICLLQIIPVYFSITQIWSAPILFYMYDYEVYREEMKDFYFGVEEAFRSCNKRGTGYFRRCGEASGRVCSG